jgi:hypothetical protein
VVSLLNVTPIQELYEIVEGTDCAEIDGSILTVNQLGNITVPVKSYLWASNDGEDWRLLSIKDASNFPNNNHDAWIDAIYFDQIKANARYLKFEFDADTQVYIDELYVNPTIELY